MSILKTLKFINGTGTMQIINSGVLELIIGINIQWNNNKDVIKLILLIKDYIYSKEINSNIIYNSLINMIIE